MLTNLLPAKILTSSIQATDMLGKAVYPYLCLRVNQSIIFANIDIDFLRLVKE